MRKLIIVLGDQLNLDSAAFSHADPARDVVWMAEVQEEATHVWCHKWRLVLFFSAMRHFREVCVSRGFRVLYHAMDDDPSVPAESDFVSALARDVEKDRPERLVLVRPGDWRVLQQFERFSEQTGLPLDLLEDTHFYGDLQEFQGLIQGKKAFRLELFYRFMRKKHRVLVDDDLKPTGGAWNFDRENRERFGPRGPGTLPRPVSFTPDLITREVIRLVEARFTAHPGTTAGFDLPVTREEAARLLEDFVALRLPRFGPYQDAMWTHEPFLYHSRLSAPLNLKLIHPGECVGAAIEAHRTGDPPLGSVEGFVRQILGWREYVRGLYWHHMPAYRDCNALAHQARLPRFFWDGETDMVCVREAMGHVLRYAYSHHIQRLMVLGLLALLLGVRPLAFHDWHMAMYADAVDWVSLPNTIGMSQHADGGIVGSKPYCATGRYIHRMSDHCRQCPYDPAADRGTTACPFTSLYWAFLHRHAKLFEGNPRMVHQLKNLERKQEDSHAFSSVLRTAESTREKFLT